MNNDVLYQILLSDVGLADVMLVLGVACHASILAYIPHPRWKAFFYALPVPFTLAVIAIGQPVNTSHVAGLPLILLFAHMTRVLHARRVPITAAITVSAIAYCLIGGMISQQAAYTPWTFWTLLGVVLLCALVLQCRLPQRIETPHRSPLPVYLKFVIVLCVISGLVTIKGFLGGTMAFFPMVGVVAAYEARFSLWTWARQIPVLMIGMSGLLAVCRMTQSVIGLLPALLCGWSIFLITVILLTREMWSRKEA